MFFHTSTSDKCPACGLGAWKLVFSNEPRLHWNYSICCNFRSNLFFTFFAVTFKLQKYSWHRNFIQSWYEKLKVFKLQKMTVAWGKSTHFPQFLLIFWTHENYCIYTIWREEGKLDSIRYGYFIDIWISFY